MISRKMIIIVGVLTLFGVYMNKKPKNVRNNNPLNIEKGYYNCYNEYRRKDMKLDEYAKLVGCTYRTAQTHFKKGLIPKSFKVGSVVFVPDNILELLEEDYKDKSNS